MTDTTGRFPRPDDERPATDEDGLPGRPDDATIDRYERATVIDVNGDKIGRVAQVYLDDADGAPSWVSVRTGLLGRHESLVPIDGIAPVDGELRVAYPAAVVKQAPRIAADDHLAPREESELHAYYRAQGWAGREPRQRPRADADAAVSTSATHADDERVHIHLPADEVHVVHGFSGGDGSVTTEAEPTPAVEPVPVDDLDRSAADGLLSPHDADGAQDRDLARPAAGPADLHDGDLGSGRGFDLGTARVPDLDPTDDDRPAAPSAPVRVEPVTGVAYAPSESAEAAGTSEPDGAVDVPVPVEGASSEATTVTEAAEERESSVGLGAEARERSTRAGRTEPAVPVAEAQSSPRDLGEGAGPISRPVDADRGADPGADVTPDVDRAVSVSATRDDVERADDGTLSMTGGHAVESGAGHEAAGEVTSEAASEAASEVAPGAALDVAVGAGSGTVSERRVSDLDEVADGGYGVGSAAPIHDGAQPLGHPVRAWRDTWSYREGPAEHVERDPDVWFVDAQAAEHAGFHQADIWV